MDVNINIPALDKLLEYTASGIGAIAGPMLAPWKSQREAKAKVIAAEGSANVLQIQAEAQTKARKALLPHCTNTKGILDIKDTINQRIEFQERKRQANIESVVRHAAEQLGDISADNAEVDHDWAARFFNDVQDVSSKEMKVLWAKVLAGQVLRNGSTSLRTLKVLKNLNIETARLFQNFCSMCIFFPAEESMPIDGRVASLDGNASMNALEKYGLSYHSLNILNEHGLIISDYNSWCIYYQYSTGIFDNKKVKIIPFRFQNTDWILVPLQENKLKDNIKIHGVSLTVSGLELSQVIDLKKMYQFTKDLHVFLIKIN